MASRISQEMDIVRYNLVISMVVEMFESPAVLENLGLEIHNFLKLWFVPPPQGVIEFIRII
jgi:hypothetical protein